MCGYKVGIKLKSFHTDEAENSMACSEIIHEPLPELWDI